MNPQNNFLERATKLVDRGFSVIPITPHAKNTLANTGAKSRTRNLDTIKVWANMWPDANAAVCADENITILESDDAPRFRGILAEMGVTLPETLTGGSRENRPHWFYKRTAACGDDCLEVPGVFEFRNFNQYVVGPGSIYPEGHQYRFWNDAPIVELPEAVINALRQLDAEYQGEGDGEAHGEHIQPGPYAALRDAYLRRLDPADLLTIEGLEVSEGERHYTLVSLAGLLHDGERSAEDIAEILRDVRDTYFEDGKGDGEIESIAEYAVRREPCQFEPWDLPSFAVGLRVFTSAEAMERWLAEHVDDFSADWSAFRAEVVPEQEVLIHLNGVPLVRQETISEVFAYRGIGKSMFIGGLIKILTMGGEFLGIHSAGGHRVLLVDGELPKALLQQRLNSLVGPVAPGLLRVRGLAQTKRSYMAPLANPPEQDAFMTRLSAWRPDVIVFDTKTAVFKHDTNDQPQLLAVNEFLMRLRAEGFAVIMTHHAGKNGTQRGRTDNDDITDLIVQLKARDGWTPGDGLEFALGFEKVRYGDRLEGFEAKWSASGGWERLALSDNAVVQALMEGKGIAKVAKEFGIGVAKVQKIRDQAKANGIEFEQSAKGGRPKKAE
jgi:hypothetical protein